MTDYQTFISLSRYARWVTKEKRRETWEDTNQRIVNFWCERLDNNFPEMLEKDKQELKDILG